MNASRPMTAAEKYYFFLDRTWPSVPLLIGRWSIAPDPADVERAWRAVLERQVTARLAVTEDLRVVDVGSEDVRFVAAEVEEADWDAYCAHQVEQAQPLGSPMRCHYLRASTGRSAAALFGHHSVVDGKEGMAMVQFLARALDGQPIPVSGGLPEPWDFPVDAPWRTDRGAQMTLMRELAAEAREGETLDLHLPPVTAERTVHAMSLPFGEEQTARLRARGKQGGFGPMVAMAAIWLRALTDVRGEVHGTSPKPTSALMVGSPADVSRGSQHGEDPQGRAVGVISSRILYGDGSVDHLGRQLQERIQRSVRRGDAEFFFHLARTGSIDDAARGAAHVERLVAATPPTMAVSNMGLLREGSDPAWMEHICGVLSPVPCQPLFLASVIYRGRFNFSVKSDSLRVPVEEVLAIRERAEDLLTGWLDQPPG